MKLQKLHEEKSPGPDGIHPKLLKECAEVLAKPLSILFETSFDTATLPKDWRRANIAAIFKKGNRSDRKNYRPVSLTSVPCKVMEGIIKEKLTHFLESNSLLCNEQHGFRKGRSCLTNLLESFEDWTKAVDEGCGLDIVFLDYKKAFDSVPHGRLILKLNSYGIGDKLKRWIRNFLTGRTMQVGVRGTFSKQRPVLSGVPQGSVIGPLLFLLYINELPTIIKNKVRMFADDTKIWSRIWNDKDSTGIQADLDKLTFWSKAWQLEFNKDKCKVMRIGHRNETKYYMMDKELEEIEEEKDLGVWITSQLKPSQQCNKAASNARKLLAMVRRTFRNLDKEDLNLLYKVYIRPHMEYSIQAWSPYLAKDIETLERVQRTATRLVPELRKYPYTERLQRLGLPTLKTRRERGDMIEVFKIMTGRELVEKEKFFKISDNHYELRGHNLKLNKERSRLEIRRNFFSQRVINSWNSLPSEVVNASSINGFKNNYDRHRNEMDNRHS